MSDRVPEGFFETTIHFTIPGQSGDVITSLGWGGAGADDPPDYAAVNDALAGLQGNVSEECIQVLISYNLGSPATDNPTHDETVNVPGEASGVAHSPTTCILVQKKSLSGGKRNRGRSYYPGAEKNSVDPSGLITPAVVVGIQTNWDDMVTAMAGLGYAAHIFHQSAPWTPTGVSSHNVEGMIATQRTRLRG